MRNFKLTDYGTIIEEDAMKELKVDTFIYQLKNGKGIFHESYFSHTLDSFYLNEFSSFEFSYRTGSYEKEGYLRISEKQKEALESGRPSNELMKLMAFSEECQFKKRQEKIVKNFYSSGNLPTDPEEILIYNEILKKELKKTNAAIVGNAAACCILPTIFTACFMFLNAESNLSFPVLINMALEGAASGLITAAFGLILSLEMGNPYKKFKEIMEQRQIIKEKLDCLNESEEKKFALEAAKSLSPEGIENNEIKEIAVNNNIFLQEFGKVREKINELPYDERDYYIKELIQILSEYDKKVVAILDRDNNTIELGDSANIWSLNTSMLPTLFNLSGRIEQRLSTIREKIELKRSLIQFKESLEEEDYTDGFTDELSDSGVAYAGKSC